MSLNEGDIALITEISARVTAEAIRNLVRGTGGATMPVSVTRLCTVEGEANNGEVTYVTPDGDYESVPATNVTGYPLQAADRVVVTWTPPSGVDITSLASRSRRGSWTPTWGGPGASLGDGVTFGWYVRNDSMVSAHALLQHGTTSNTGAGPMVIGGLPCPARNDGDGLPWVGHGWCYDLSRRRPIQWIVYEGQDFGDIWAFYTLDFAGNSYATNTGVGAGVPQAWANGHQIYAEIHYETDAP